MTSLGDSTDTSRKAHRAPYREAGTAMREAMARLAKVRVEDRRRHVWWQIVADAIVLVGSYSKTSDVGVAKELAGRHGVSTDTVGRALAWGHEVGAIRWQRVGAKWWLGLPTAENATPHNRGTSAESDSAHRGEICGVSEKTSEKNRGRRLVAVLVQEAKRVTPTQADRIDNDVEVGEAANRCVAAGRTWADVRKALDERRSSRIDHGPRWALAVLRRVETGESLRQRKASKRRPTTPRPPEAFGETSQTLSGW